MGTKAFLRATREEVGLSQQELANRMGVKVLSVKRWESEKAEQMPPAEVFLVLGKYLERRQEIVEKVVKIAPDLKEPIKVSYYRDQEHYDSRGRDEGPFTVANANSRAVCRALTALGYEVEFVYFDENFERIGDF